VYLRGGSILSPAPRWKTWAFLLGSSPLPQPGPTAPLCPPPPTRGTPLGHDPGAQVMTAHRHTDTLPRGSMRREVQRFEPTTGTRPRPSSLDPPPVASLLRLPLARPAATPSQARTVPAPADGAPNTSANPGPQPQVGVPDAVGAPVARTPATDQSDKGPAHDASRPPPPVEAPLQRSTARASPRDHLEGPMQTDPDPL